MFFVGSAFHLIVPALFPDVHLQYETQSELFRRWNGTWTKSYMMVHPFLYGSVFAAVFLTLRMRTAFPSGLSGGLAYGAGVFLAGSLPVFVLAFASFQVSAEIISLWILQNLCQYLVAGVAVGMVADGMTVRVSTELKASADHVWERLLQKKTFLYLIRGWLVIENSQTWPDTLFLQGSSFLMKIRLFGRGPLTSQEVRIVRVDESAREIVTDESSRIVRTWKHRMNVDALPENRSRYTDCVDINAGLLTPVVWIFASLFYRARQRRWRHLLADVNSGYPDV